MIASPLLSCFVRCGRIPIKLRERRVNNQVTGAPHFETKINLCEFARERLVESADLLENFATHQNACAGDCAVIASHPQLAVHAGVLRRETVKSGLRNSIHAKNKTSVLNRAIRIDQSRADCANLGPLHMLSHDCEPIRIDGFHVASRKRSQGLSVCATA